MSENSWQESDSYNELESLPEEACAALAALMGDLPASEDQVDDLPYPGFKGRRRKAATVLVVIWGGTIALHLISWGAWIVWGLMGLLWMQAFRVLFAEPKPALPPFGIGNAVRLYQSVDASDRDPIEDALRQCHNNKSRAAQFLGLTLRQLNYRMTVLDIGLPERMP